MASSGFELTPPVRDVVAAAAPMAPERFLRAYALSIQTVGGGPDTRVDVLARQARSPGGPLVAITGSQAAGVFGMSRSLGLCGLVSLRLDTALAQRAYVPGDPARVGDLRFTDEASLDVDTRMRVTDLHLEGAPCSPRPTGRFSIGLQARSSEVVDHGAAIRQSASGKGAFAEVRYECLAAPVPEPASRLHPDLPGDMLRVDCRRIATPGGITGHLNYAWIASSAVYLLTGHRGQDIAQSYVYTDVVLDP